MYGWKRCGLYVLWILGAASTVARGSRGQAEITLDMLENMESCERGVPEGCDRVGVALVEAGWPTAAESYFRKACDGGDPEGCSHLAELSGEPMPRPESLAPADGAPGQEDTCEPSAARVLGRTYALSNPVRGGDEFSEFVAENASSFGSDGAVVQCALALGSHLAQNGQDAFDPNAYEQAVNDGMGSDAKKVADSLNSGAVDLFAMGRELLWLAKVLPPAASGDFGPFLTTGTETRTKLREFSAYGNSMGSIVPEMSGFGEFMDTLSRQVFDILAEDQIVMLATMLPR